jgi:hypothetical protein
MISNYKSKSMNRTLLMHKDVRAIGKANTSSKASAKPRFAVKR